MNIKMSVQTNTLLVTLVAHFCGVLCGTTTPCEDNWTAFEGSCYLFGHDLFHFTEAETFCRIKGAHLVHIESDLENTFLKSHLSDMDDIRYWIGLTDTATENIWRWVDTDSIANYTHWRSGEPDGGKGENCVAIWEKFGLDWIDEPCTSYANKAICEKRPNTEMEIVG